MIVWKLQNIVKVISLPGQEWCKVRLREGPAKPKYRPRPQWLSNSQQCLCLGLAWSARRQTTNTSRKLRGTLLKEKKPLESEYIIKYGNPFFVYGNLSINHMYILYKLSIISRIYIQLFLDTKKVNIQSRIRNFKQIFQIITTTNFNIKYFAVGRRKKVKERRLCKN